MVTLITGPRIGASGENVSPPTTGHQKGQKWSGVSVRKIFFSHFFLNEATAGSPRHVFENVHANIRRSDLPMFNSGTQR